MRIQTNPGPVIGAPVLPLFLSQPSVWLQLSLCISQPLFGAGMSCNGAFGGFLDIAAELQHYLENAAASNPWCVQGSPISEGSFRCWRDWTCPRGAETAWIPFSRWPRTCLRPGPTVAPGSPDLRKAGGLHPSGAERRIPTAHALDQDRKHRIDEMGFTPQAQASHRKKPAATQVPRPEAFLSSLPSG
ncbi:hypothetical protein B0T18DRAFT_134571 [Schizothecium vesticola]|uniref:Uncharacterized protein n=1 Tax=Schizothecium vesticola TaxID=314040 RepID=A0AA40EU44_9PEZI|nr:hypothetical protein B0T18DRAFT_134571 [Schizothecium vesticola]